MTINLSNLDKEELKELFSGFDAQFLNAPLKSPSKTLKRYMPTGFRASKVPRQLVVRMYCDAILGAEPSLCKYVTAEVTRVFEITGIVSYCDTHDLSQPLTQMKALVEISSILWRNGVTIPSYIVLLLAGAKRDNEQKRISQELNLAHFETIDRVKQDSEKKGRQESDIEHRLASEAADKNSKKQQKQICTLQEQLKRCRLENSNLQEQLEQLQEEVCVLKENIEQIQELNDAAKKKIVSLANENNGQREQIDSLLQKIQTYDEQFGEIEKLNSTINELRVELSRAKEQAYSEAVLKRLCGEVIDELRASSLSTDAVLKIAKTKFSEAVSVESAWSEMSNSSVKYIKDIIEKIANSEAGAQTLDEIEEIEDSILIKFAVIKALKSLVYNELEAKEMQRTIAGKFEQV